MNENMKSEKDIFQILDGHEEAHSAQAWNKLERRLGPAQSKKAMVWRIAAALLLLLVGTGAYYTGFRKQDGAGNETVAQVKPGKAAQVVIKNEPVGPKANQKVLQIDEPVEQLASVEPAKPTTKYLPNTRPRTVEVDKILDGSAKGSRKATSNQTAQVAEVEKIQNNSNSTIEKEEKLIAQPEQVAVIDPKTETALPSPQIIEMPVLVAKVEPAAEPMGFTMELHPTKLAVVEPDEAEDNKDPNRPLLTRLVKSASDLAKGKVRGQDLKNRGTAALNNLLGRKPDMEPTAEKENN